MVSDAKLKTLSKLVGKTLYWSDKVCGEDAYTFRQVDRVDYFPNNDKIDIKFVDGSVFVIFKYDEKSFEGISSGVVSSSALENTYCDIDGYGNLKELLDSCEVHIS